MRAYKLAMTRAILEAIPDIAVELDMLTQNPKAGDVHIVPALKKILRDFDEAFLLLNETEHQVLVYGIFFKPDCLQKHAEKIGVDKHHVYSIQTGVIQHFEHLVDNCWAQFLLWEKYKDAADYATTKALLGEFFHDGEI